MAETSQEMLDKVVARETWTADDHRELLNGLAQVPNACEKLRKMVRQLESQAPAPKGALAVKVGIARYMACRFAGALEALNAGTDNRDRRYFQAQCCKQLGRYDNAIEELERARARGWDETDVELEIIEVRALAGQVEQADRALSKFTRKLGKTARYLYLRGLIDELRGNVEGAGEAYQKAVDAEGDCVPALFRLAYFCDLHGEEEEAMSLYQRCLECRPAHAGALMNLAVLYEDAEEYDLACHCLRRILAINPTHWRARLFLRDAESAKTMYFDEDRARLIAQRNAILDTPVTDFELSVRARNCLRKMNINTLGDLVRTPEARLLEYKNFGETSLKEIRDMLAIKGLRLGQALEEEPQQELGALFADRPARRADEAVLATPLEQVELSVRARKALEALNIVTLGDLAAKTEAELLACRNFGQTSLNAVRECLAEYNLRLREPD